jgi:hypothetical protein
MPRSRSTTHVPSPAEGNGPRGGVWGLLLGMLGAPVAWVLHLLASYFLVALACTTGWSGLQPALIVTTIVFAVAAAGAGVLSYRRWREGSRAQAVLEALMAPGGTAGFFWIMGIVLSGIFTLTILLAGMTPLFVSPCT